MSNIIDGQTPDTEVNEADTTSTSPVPETAEPATPQPQQAPPETRLVMLDPNLVEIEENIRKKVVLSKRFVATIRQVGILQPVPVVEREDGSYLAKLGQRRVLGAREAGVLLPAFVLPADDSRATTITDQLIENAQREAVTDQDEAEAYRQLAFEFGMSVTQIAAKTGTDRKRVTAGIATAGSETAKQAVATGQVNLFQAAVLTEFADEPEIVAQLTEVAIRRPDGFDHEAQRARDERERRQQLEATIKEYADRGIRVVDAPDRWDTQETTAYLSELQDAEGTPLTLENYEDKPGYALVIEDRWSGIEVTPVVTEWASHGLRKITHGGAVRGKMTESEKAERRELIANNKAWDSAEKVRRAWLAELFARKAAPKDAAVFIARALLHRPGAITEALHNSNSLARTLLGFGPKSYDVPDPLVAQLDAAPGKATALALALSVSAIEDATSRSTWRAPDSSDREYLQTLQGWGYTLSEVEQIVIDKTEPAKGKARRRTAKPKQAEPAQAEPAQTEDAAEPATGEDDTEPEADTE